MLNISDQLTGRWVSILTMLGVDEKILNSRRHHPCPGCGGKDRFRFTNYNNKGGYICSQCGNGDGFQLLDIVFGWDFKQSKEEIEKIFGETKLTHVKQHDPMPLLKFVAGNAKNNGDEVTAYLKSRGLKPSKYLKQVRLKYYTEGVEVGAFESMAGLIVDKDAQPVSYHVTYLKDGIKADLPNSKKILPGKKSITGCAVRFGIGEVINVTEGIETALAVQEITNLPTWAALNAGNLESLEIPDSVKKINIYADNDKSFTGQKSAYILANKLVVQKGRKVEVFYPEKPETDYLDYYVENFNQK